MPAIALGLGPTPDLIELGDTLTLSAQLWDAGVLTDPSTLTFSYRDGTGTRISVALASLTKVSTGSYSYSFVPNKAGPMAYTWASTVPGASSSAILWIEEARVV